MQNPSGKIIGFIATGDELTCGDVLNTTGPTMARQLQPLGFALPYHLMVNDEQKNIVQAIRTIQDQCDIIIISGGLGPTSDDRTRFALAEVLQLPLMLDETVWQQISDRLKKAQLPVDEHNRQQALFPKGASILANPHGTAAGCGIEHQGKIFYLLPGPPSECLPMFENFVLPTLQSYASPYAASKWLLLGVSEGEIAAKLDAAVADLNCRTGYRWEYPYLEYKMFTTDPAVLEQACANCLPLVEPYLISKHNLTALEQLKTLLIEKNLSLYLSPTPLNQRYQKLFNPEEQQVLFSNVLAANAIVVDLTGFDEWFEDDIQLPLRAKLQLTVQLNNKKIISELSVYYRDNRIGLFLRERISQQILGMYTPTPGVLIYP